MEVSSGTGNESPAAGKGKIASGYGLEAQTSSPAKKKTTIVQRSCGLSFSLQALSADKVFRCRSKTLLSEKDKDLEASLWGKGSTSQNKAALQNFYSDEYKEGFLGLVGSDPRGPTVMVLPSTPKIRGKGLRFLGNCGLLAAENLEVTPSSTFQSPSSHFPPSYGSISPFLSPAAPTLPSSVIQSLNPLENREKSEFFVIKDDDGTVGQTSVGFPNLVLEVNQTAHPSQMTESVNPVMPNTNPSPIQTTVSQSVFAGSPTGELWKLVEGVSRRWWEGHKFMRKLQFLKAKLKEWNKNAFGDLIERKKCILLDIANFDSMEQEGGLSPELLIQRAVGIPFTEEEISKAIFQMDRIKHRGLMDLLLQCFQDCWDVIKEDLVRVFDEFHRSGIINQSTNASFIVLLPKKSMAKKISDYRPISLITSLYKIIAKVLAGRLRGILHETIHSTQGAFVQGRQILDAVLKANEIVDEKKRSGEEGVVF
ncbi:Transposon TX1 uncharacterized 149 kDa protein [Vitis vinifera]|uniref:Transposon TX1 uncharacterized 149 kDa protein n=1 Tax=Vitis vinifera TaxID=29760 RepID=A0A438EZN8_VITVI|nr:Transposon TX1 uncharacterized 149 kDa protein [Vitis vinifera]